MYVDFMYILGVYSLVLGNSCNMIFRQILCLNLSMGYWRLWSGYFCFRHKLRLFPRRLLVPGGCCR